MHIPDGFLNNAAAMGTAMAAAGVVAVAARRVRSAFLRRVAMVRSKLVTSPSTDGGATLQMRNELTAQGKEKIWRMATIGAFIFSAQMVNFPIGGGTSGHLLGGVLAALVLGPWEALLVISAVLGVQAAMFGDGGIAVLGANIINMGVIGALGGYSVFHFLTKGRLTRHRFLWGAGVAAWISVVMAAVGASLELALSGTIALARVLPAMVLAHTFIGIGEGLITVAVLAFLLKRQYPLMVLEKMKEKAEYEEI